MTSMTDGAWCCCAQAEQHAALSQELEEMRARQAAMGLVRSTAISFLIELARATVRVGIPSPEPEVAGKGLVLPYFS